jgi:hypothetical protein
LLFGWCAENVVKARISLGSSHRGGVAAQCSATSHMNTHNDILDFACESEADTTAGLLEKDDEHSFRVHGYHGMLAKAGVPLLDLAADVV